MRKVPSPTHVFFTVALACISIAADSVFTQSQSPMRQRRIVIVDGREAVEGEVIVRYRNRSGRFERERAELQANSTGTESIGRLGARRVRSNTMTTRQMVAALRANPDVEMVEPNYIIRANAAPNDSSFASLWGLFNNGQTVDGSSGAAGVDIDATSAWDVTTGSRANIVALADTGIDYDHPDLAANVFTAPRAFTVALGSLIINCPAGSHGFNAVNNNCDPVDDNGHGTHIAGIIGAVGDNGEGITGVNWAASMMALKVLDADGAGTTADAIRAIDFAIKAKQALGTEANVRVINASWGGPNFSQALADEIAAANTAEMLFVASAGSNAQNNDTTPHYPASISAANIISVAALDNTGALASHSNYGGNSVHLAAPGTGILSTLPDNSYGFLGGTSMSAPFVSGAAALLLGHCPGLSTAQLKSALLSTVDLRPSLSAITTTGGSVNAGAAVRSCTPSSLTVNDSTAPLSVEANSTLTVVVANGAATVGDWVTLVPTGSPANHWSGNYQFLNGTTTRPTAGMPGATLTFAAPSSSGTFEFRFLLNGTYTRLATSQVITVTAGNPSPVIGSLSPASVNAGSSGFTLTLTGTGFMSGSQARVNGVDRPTTYVSSTSLTVAVPASDVTTGGPRSITVVNPNPGGGTSAAATLNVASGPSLTVNGSSGAVSVGAHSAITVVVANGPANVSDWVTMVPAGSPANHWSGTYQFLSGSTTRPAAGMSGATLTFTAPASSGTYEFRFLHNSSYSQLAASGVITVTGVNPAPAISTLSTSNVNVNSPDFTLTLTGTGFIAGSQARVNGADRSTTYASSTSLTVAILASDLTTPGTRAITVVNPAPGGGTSAAATLTVVAPPSVTVNGSSGPITVGAQSPITVVVANGPANVGDWVTMVPAGSPANQWSGVYQFLSGSTTRPATGMSGATLTFTAPAASGTYEFRFLHNSSYSQLAASGAITVTGANPSPAISALSTSSVNVNSPGFTLTLSGTGFIAGSQARLNGADRTTTYGSPTSLNVAVLASDLTTAGTRAITVINPGPGGGTSTAATLTVVAPPSVTVNGSSGSITVGAHSAMTVVVANGPANVSDWVTLVPVGSPANHWSGIYQFLSGTTTRPATGMPGATLTFAAPAASGTYEFRFLQNSTYTQLATSGVVTVTGANPSPAISSLSTTRVNVNSPDFTLTLTGTGFVTGSQVRINGSDRTTTFVSATSLTVAVPASDLTTAGARAVTVVNAAPGGGTSAAATLTVVEPPSITVSGASEDMTVSGHSTITVVVANGPGSVSDWVTLVPVGSPADHWSGIYQFLSGTTTRPAAGISDTTLTFTPPAGGGTFEFRFLHNSTYTRLATSQVITIEPN